MNSRFLPKALAAAALGGALLAAMPAAAASTMEMRVTQVRYGDLDIADPEGRAKLDQRLNRAARRVCGPVENRDAREAAEAVACQRAALEQAQATIETRLAARKGRAQVASVADR